MKSLVEQHLEVLRNTTVHTGSKNPIETGSQGQVGTGSQGPVEASSQGPVEASSQGPVQASSQGPVQASSQGHKDGLVPNQSELDVLNKFSVFIEKIVSSPSVQ
jgi:uncharacterized protein (DUF2345 family)